MDPAPWGRALSGRAPGEARESLIPADLDATIVLLRHGESVFITEGRFQGQADTPLSPLGERQAKHAARRLAEPGGPPILPVPTRPPVEIVHSPLARTARTAELVAAGIRKVHSDRSAPLRPDPAFLEIAQGEWEGLTRDEIERRYGELLAAWRRTPLEANAPGGERVVVVDRRVRDGLAREIGRAHV